METYSLETEKTGGPAGWLLTSEISKTMEPQSGRTPSAIVVWLAVHLFHIDIFEADTSSAIKTYKKQKANLSGFITTPQFCSFFLFLISCFSPHSGLGTPLCVPTSVTTFSLCTPSLSRCPLLFVLLSPSPALTVSLTHCPSFLLHLHVS